MKKVNSIIEFGDGEILDRINFELLKVIENINNPLTDEKARVITVQIKLTPSNRRKNISIETTVKSKLSPTNPVQTQMIVQGNESKIVAFESDGIGDGQIDIFGEIHQIKYVNLINDDEQEKEQEK